MDNSHLPEIFYSDRHYSYYRAEVKYECREGSYYKFRTLGGADLLIDADHTQLIKTQDQTYGSRY